MLRKKVCQCFEVFHASLPTTVPFKNMWTLKFKAQLTNGFLATLSQMCCGSSQLPITAECMVIKSLCTFQSTKQCSTVVVSWEDPLNI